MLEKCLKCNTSFEVDQNLITPKLKFFKCSVCDNEWPVNLIKKTEEISNEKLQKDLEAIRSEIKKKTDLLGVGGRDGCGAAHGRRRRQECSGGQIVFRYLMQANVFQKAPSSAYEKKE